MSDAHVDVLAIAAHPDDIEMSAGGTVAKLVREGKSVAIIDCTRGELGTRGSVELRDAEALSAAAILGVIHRENLNMIDGNIEVTEKNILRVVHMLRKYRPRIMIFPPSFERHPDHEAVHQLCRAAYFKSGLPKVITRYSGLEEKPHRPQHLFCYIQAYHHEADFFVDISETHDVKIESVRAFGSQVHVPNQEQTLEPQTFISRPEFMEMLEARARYFGTQIGVRYAEGFISIEPIGIESLSVWL